MISQEVLDQVRSPAGLEALSSRAEPGKGLVSEFAALWAQGVPADARDFLAGHPEVPTNKSLVLDLAYEEYCCRKESGDTPDAEEFCARYPSLKASLRRIIQAHRFLEESSPPLDAARARLPQAGDTLLGFTLQRELGRGAFARVFLATEHALGNRPVAVKISLQGTAEAETLGRLRHENIVPVHSVREDARTGLTAVCMPYAGSATLCDVLDRAYARPTLPSQARVILEAARDSTPGAAAADDRQPPDRLLQDGTYVKGVIHLGALLADALAFTHSQGILHRDLKPSNVLLTPAGQPMLLDFNLSFDERATEERLGGTLPYMAPEHLRATDQERGFDPAAVDARSDVFSLGVILYELLTGLHPFGQIPANLSLAEVRAHLLRRQPAGPNPLRRANRSVSPALARVIESCLAFDAKDRTQSAAELAVALRKYLSLWRRGCRWLVRHWLGVLGGAVLVLVLAGGTAVANRLSVPEPVRAGLEAYDKEDYAAATEHFRQAADAEPTNPWAWFALGRARQKQALLPWILELPDNKKLLALAVEDLERASELSSDGRIAMCLGFCHSLLPNHPKALQGYRAALVAGLGSAEVSNNLGYSYLHGAAQANGLETAKDCFDRAINSNPNLVAAYHNRAFLHYRQSMRPAKTAKEAKGALEAIDAMIADIKMAINLSPPTPETSELYADAAHLYARAAVTGKRWIQQASSYGRMAIDFGQDPALVNARIRLVPQFAPLAPAETPPQRMKMLWVVDPLPAMPAEILSGR
jgi:serine/threonine protein kinase/Flp pilus assembly protein TadD